jgi:hypothetical protein
LTNTAARVTAPVRATIKANRAVSDTLLLGEVRFEERCSHYKWSHRLLPIRQPKVAH